MTNELATSIVEAAEYYADGEVTIMSNYSGRGMFGNTTTAIVGDLDDIENCFAQELKISAENKDNDTMACMLELAAEFICLKMDSMGRSDVVLY